MHRDLKSWQGGRLSHIPGGAWDPRGCCALVQVRQGGGRGVVMRKREEVEQREAGGAGGGGEAGN